MILPVLFAADDSGGLFADRFWQGFLGSIMYGLLGIALMLLAYKIFDWMTPRVDMQLELTEKKNTAVAVVIAALFVGVSVILAVAIH